MNAQQETESGGIISSLLIGNFEFSQIPQHCRQSIRAHPDFEEKYQQNPDTHNRMLAFGKIFEDVMLKTRRTEMELYKLLANDSAFKAAMQQSLQRVVGL